MRWALVKVALAVTVMVVVAFAVPLGLVIKEMARDRAVTNAERQAATIAPTLTITPEQHALEVAVQTTHAGTAGRMFVHVPADPDAGVPKAVDIGTPAPDAPTTPWCSGCSGPPPPR